MLQLILAGVAALGAALVYYGFKIGCGKCTCIGTVLALGVAVC
jgi:hypothetical protein